MKQVMGRQAFGFVLPIIFAVFVWIGVVAGESRSVPWIDAPLGDAFTYQGLLEQSGTQINGACDFQFSLWTAISGGTQIGMVQSVNGVYVVNGRFSVALNENGELAAEPFTGRARYLQVAVRCAGDGMGYTALTPRQALTAVPYALGLRPGATISGTVDAGSGAINLVSNRDGLRIQAAMGDGVFVDSTAGNALSVSSPEDVGLFVRQATNGIEMDQISSNGVYLNGVGENGLHVVAADNNAIQIDSYGNYGIQVQGGVTETRIASGFFQNGLIVQGGCNGCDLTIPAVNLDAGKLVPGDVVTVLGLSDVTFANADPVLEVQKAAPGEALVGVVVGSAEIQNNLLAARMGKSAESGSYVTILYAGIAEVNAGEASITAGERVTLGNNGVRSLQTTEVNGLQLAEDAPTLGIALDTVSAEGKVLVLINPQ